MTGATRTRSRALHLTGRGRLFVVVAIVLLVLAYALGNREFQWAAVLVGALVVIAIVIVRTRRPRVEVTRTFSPPIVAAGGSTVVSLDVRNIAAQRSASATWYDVVPWGSGRSPIGALPSLAPRGQRHAPRNATTLAYTIHPPRRGVFEVGPLMVGFADPFALAGGETMLAGTRALVVTPALVQLHDIGLGVASGEGTARLVQRDAQGSDDDLMTREYRRGDALRRVHWRASARHGELMVRQEERRAKPELRLIVDTRRSGYGDAGSSGGPRGRSDDPSVESETFEWVVRMVASLGIHLSQAGYSVQLVESGAAQVAPLAGDAGELERSFLTSLAGIRLVAVSGRERVGPAEAVGGSIFAVVAEPDADTLHWLVRQRRAGERAVAFVPQWAVSTRAVLLDAGWQCVGFRPGDDLATVWASVGTLAAS